MIMKGRAPLRLPLAGALTIALAAAATLPAWATAQQSPPPPPPASAVQTAPAVRPSAPAPVPVPAQDSLRRPTRAPATPTAALAVPDQTRPTAPPPPPAPASAPQDKRVVRTQAAPVPKVVSVEPAKDVRYTVRLTTKLPPEGQQLVSTYDADVALIYKEIQGKVEARRQAAIKALEALQDQFTKQGKLDEAVAIRDYLKAGGPQEKIGLYRFVDKRR